MTAVPARPDAHRQSRPGQSADGRPRRSSRRPAGPGGEAPRGESQRSGQRPPSQRTSAPRSGGRSNAKASPPRTSSPALSATAITLAAAAELPMPEIGSFAELGLNPALTAALTRSGIHAPFAVQIRVLPDALAGRDVLAKADTGSGKTLAFGLPVVARLAAAPARRVPGTPRAVILVPTRELAGQVSDVLEPLAVAVGLRVTTIVGGLPINRQMDQLRRGTDIVVATPGRLLDLVQRGSCRLSSIEIGVLDEADHLADLGFLPAVRRILDSTPAGGQRLLLSATLDGDVDRLVQEYLSDPAMHAVPTDDGAAGHAEHHVFRLRSEEKVALAAEVAGRPGRTLFFVRTKHGADRLVKQLSRHGVEATAIHGNRNQNQRQRALASFAAGRPRVMVATDVAARGIHVDAVELVVHYDLPADHKDYVHRSGRTARAGADGLVVSFVDGEEQFASVARLHRGASITATTTGVYGGHPAVRALLEA